MQAKRDFIVGLSSNFLVKSKTKKLNLKHQLAPNLKQFQDKREFKLGCILLYLPRS